MPVIGFIDVIIFTEKRNQLTYTTVVLYLTFAYIFPSLKLVKSKIFLHVKKPSLVNMFVADHRKLCIGIPPLAKGPKGRSCPLAVCGKTKRSKHKTKTQFKSSFTQYHKILVIDSWREGDCPFDLLECATDLSTLFASSQK